MGRRLSVLAFVVLLAVAIPASAGTIYLDLYNDPNPGNVTVSVRSVSSSTPIYSVSLAPNKGTGVQVLTVPSGNYVVSFAWPNPNFHNLAAGGGHANNIATCNPPTGACVLSSWQAAGTGVNASIPVKVP